MIKLGVKQHLKKLTVREVPAGTLFDWNGNTWLRTDSGVIALTTTHFQDYPDDLDNKGFFDGYPGYIHGELEVSKS